MLRKMALGMLLVLPLGIAGILFASSASEAAGKTNAAESGFVCPLTGETLPCPKCCPLNKN